MTSALQDVLGLLDLEPIEVNIFRGASPDEDRQRTFGGQVAGQALVAAARTVDSDRRVHSLHAYFLRPGDPRAPILYEVDRIRDGRSFTTRRVVGIQHGRAIFNLAASFHLDEPGFEHQLPMPDVPGPNEVPSLRERAGRLAERRDDAWWDQERPISLRYVTIPPYFTTEAQEPCQQVWMKANGSMPDDPLLHTCLLTYASDLTLLDTALTPHAKGSYGDDGLMMASLDHAMWFHRPFRFDEWMLYDQQTPSAGGARGLARGSVFTHDGALAVSVMQEGLIRVVDR